jgi:hypothetical protein
MTILERAILLPYFDNFVLNWMIMIAIFEHEAYGLIYFKRQND